MTIKIIHKHYLYDADGKTAISVDGLVQLEKKIDKLLSLAFINNKNQSEMKADLSSITQEVTESTDAQQSAVILLKGLKQKLDEAGVDQTKLKELSDSLSASTDELAAAIVANTPAEDAAPDEL